LKDSLLPECAQGKVEDVPHRRRRKRNSDSDDGVSINKREATEKSRPLPVYQKPRPMVTKNFFALLRAVPMEGAEVTKNDLQTTILTKADHTPHSSNF
jgi:hypothetical protein